MLTMSDQQDMQLNTLYKDIYMYMYIHVQGRKQNSNNSLVI